MTTATKTRTLTTALGVQPVYKALVDGTIPVEGVSFDFQEVKPITVAFRKMCRTLDYDIAEMAVATYFSAREYGIPFTALPAIVLSHGAHGAIVYNADTGVSSPQDLEGKSVGMRAYTVTPGIWTRGILKLEHGVDLEKITWVANDDEHVAQYASHDPANVVRKPGADLNRELADGELAAGLWGAGDNDRLKPFYPDADAAARAFYQQYGAFPVSHLIVVKDSVLAEYPWLAQALFEAFSAAKADALHREPHAHIGGAGIVDGDPLPYGLEANRASLQMLVDMCIDQQVLRKPATLEELFPLQLG